jgi:hypothetical protein
MDESASATEPGPLIQNPSSRTAQLEKITYLSGLGAIGADRLLGLDAYLKDLELVRNNRWLRYTLG